MKTLDAIEAFCRVVQTSSFRAAADALQVPLTTVSRLVHQLEDRLGVKLLLRTTRRVSPTLEGMSYYEQVLPLLTDLENLNRSVIDGTSAVSGMLVMSVPRSIAQLLIAPALPGFLSTYPGISQVCINCTDRIVDLAHDKLDAVVRTGRPTDDRLVSRPLARMPQYFAGSTSWLKRVGMPQSVEALADYPFVGYGAPSVSGLATLTATRVGCPPIRFSAKCRVVADDAQTYIQMAAAGLGLIEASLLDLRPYLHRGELVIVLPQVQGEMLDYSFMYLQHRHVAKRVRVFHDWLKPLMLEASRLQPITADGHPV